MPPRPLSNSAIPNDLPTQISKTKTRLPLHLSATLPPRILKAFTTCLRASDIALHEMRLLNLTRQTRFRALCPQSDRILYDKHFLPINRLTHWTEDADPENPTLAPSAKIPAMGMTICLCRAAYEGWKAGYEGELLRYKEGAWMEWCRAKAGFELEVLMCRNSAEITEKQAQEVERWFCGVFLKEMKRWEGYVEELELPGFKELVEELREAVLCCVEDGEEVWGEVLERAKSLRY
ncbi:hypothetical protein BJX61DRAFT_544491 [Aspergillus egyptiacus]|nr:hypothetical protein BJX61DRAFT_544491 [Aspergillus egyptiacus]